MVTKKQATQEAKVIENNYWNSKLDVPEDHKYYGMTCGEIRDLNANNKKQKIEKQFEFSNEYKHDINLDELFDKTSVFGGGGPELNTAEHIYKSLVSYGITANDLEPTVNALAYRSANHNFTDFNWFGGVNEEIVSSEFKLMDLLFNYGLGSIEDMRRGYALEKVL